MALWHFEYRHEFRNPIARRLVARRTCDVEFQQTNDLWQCASQTRCVLADTCARPIYGQKSRRVPRLVVAKRPSDHLAVGGKGV